MAETTEIYSLTVQEARGLKSGFWQVCTHSENYSGTLP
jgi:hypothetical protein